jgi:hypothetical protein
MLAERPLRAPSEEMLLCFNGIDGRDGSYLLPRLAPRSLADLARGRSSGIGGIGGASSRADRSWVRELETWVKRWGKVRRGLKEGLDPGKLDESGWGVIFPATADAGALKDLRDALAPLLDHRRAQAGGRFREFAGDDGYRPGETKVDFLARHGAGPGPADPEKVPYYLLLVGDPEDLPFPFQFQLDVQYAVGRLCFDRLEEYRSYAESVVAAETGRVERQPRASFFAPVNPGDPVSGMTSACLAQPVAAAVQQGEAGWPRWDIETVLGEEATRDRLGRLLEGEAPAFLFTACHGLGFPAGDAQQRDLQGALVCRDWPGPGGGGIRREHYFAAADVGEAARVHGLVAFCFACFGAGTPRWDDYTQGGQERQRPLSPRAFLGRLPQRLLSHPGGGALAVVGHVERAWGFSFAWTGAGRQTAVFESTVRRLLAGQPVGWAMEFFNQRYAELAVDLAAEVEALSFGKKLDETRLADLFTASRDARNYTVIGDPAVRVATGPATLAEGGPKP